MTYSKNSTPENRQPNYNFSISQKGLGWIPDIPEQRDYSLIEPVSELQRKLQRGRRSEASKRIGKALIDSIKDALGDSKLDIEKLITKIQENFSGDSEFLEFRVYKSLQKGMSDNDLPKIKARLSIIAHKVQLKVSRGKIAQKK